MPSHTLHPTNFQACGYLRKSTDHKNLFDTNFQVHHSHLQISSFTHSGQGSSKRDFFSVKNLMIQTLHFLATII